MSLIKEAGRLVGNGLLRVVFGPETRGLVQEVRRDRHTLEDYHVLVKTDQGGLKHFTFSDNDTTVASFEEMQGKIARPWWIRTRDTGSWLLPGSRIERDPFNLRGQS